MIKAINEVIGGLFGLVLFYAWIFFLNSISYIFFSETYTIHGTDITKMKISVQIFEWFAVGLLLLFIVFGHYLMSSRTMDVSEKTRDIKIIKANLIGFVIWLIVIVLTHMFHFNILHLVNLSGGYITILIVYLLLSKFL